MDGPRGIRGKAAAALDLGGVIAMSRPLRCFNILLVGLALAAKKKRERRRLIR